MESWGFKEGEAQGEQRGALITFRALQRSDFPLLGEWLKEPHVARWWADDSSPEGLEEDYGDCIDGKEPAQVFIACRGAKPLGLAQRLRLGAYPEYIVELERLMKVPETASSIDYLIGRPADIGRGLGTEMLRAFTARLWRDDPHTSAIVVPVHAANVASWRVLERVGFVRVASGELEPDNPADNRDHFIYSLHRP